MSYSRDMYQVWWNMIRRCYYEKHPAYKDYGQRGISVCDSWRGRGGYRRFLQDMGERPEGYSLERKDNNLGYSPNNCVWETLSRQQRNRRGTKVMSFMGIECCLREWDARCGFRPDVIRDRLSRGWTFHEALMTELGSRKKLRGTVWINLSREAVDWEDRRRSIAPISSS